MNEIKTILEESVNRKTFSGTEMYNKINAILTKNDSTSEFLSSMRGNLSESSYKYVVTALLRNVFLIELVNNDISSTKMEVRWTLKESRGKKQEVFNDSDPRFCSFEDCVKIFLKLLEELAPGTNREDIRNLITLYQNYNILPYEIPLDYINAAHENELLNHIYYPENFQWLWNENYQKTIQLREILLNPNKNGKSELFSSILKDKIKVKTYLTDRVQTGKHMTNREKRWEVHPESVHFALRKDCLLVEHSLISQLCHFEGFPKEIFDLVKNKIILEKEKIYRCPVTLEPLNFQQFEDEIRNPSHGKSNFHVGHLNPLKLKIGDPTCRHTYQNIGWFSQEGNRIQGSLSLAETRNLLSRIMMNYTKSGMKLE